MAFLTFCKVLPAAGLGETEISHGRVTAVRVVEAFDVVEHVCLGLSSRAVDRLSDPLGFERGNPKGGGANKLSMGALSQTLPDWTCNGFVPVTYLIMPPWLRTRAG